MLWLTVDNGLEMAANFLSEAADVVRAFIKSRIFPYNFFF